MIFQKVWNKYLSIGRPAKASLWFVICSFLQKGISFIVIPIYTRLLTTEQYGVYSVFLSWSEILFVFTSLYLHGNTFNVGLVKFERNREGFTSSLLGLCMLLCAGFIGSYALFPNFWQTRLGLSNSLCIALWIFLFFTPFWRFWGAIQRFNFQYRAMVNITLVMAVLTPIVSISLIQFTDFKAEAIIFSKTAIESIVGFILMILLLRKRGKIYDKEYWIYGLKANIPLIPYYLSATFLGYIDRIMIEKYCGAAEAAVYSVAHSAAMILLFLNSALNSSLTPWLFQKIKKGEGWQNIAVNRMLVLGVTAVNFLLILFAPEVISFMAPDKYNEAIFVIPPLAVSVIFNFVYQQFINVEFYYEANKFTMAVSILAALMNVTLNALLIPRFGYFAAGYTTMASYFMFMVLHGACVKYVMKRRKVTQKYFDMRFLIVLVMGIMGCMVAITLVYDKVLIRYGLAVLVFAVIGMKRKQISQALLKLHNK